MVNVKRAVQSFIFFLSLSLCNSHTTEASIQSLTLKHRHHILLCDVVPPLQTKQNKVPLSLVVGLGVGWGFESSTSVGGSQSGLGASLAVGVRPRGAGVRVRVVVVVLVLRQAFLTYPPVGGAEASQQALVVETAALLPERVLW